MSHEAIREFRAQMGRFGKVVVWGLRTQKHTHRYIHQAFANTLCALEIPMLWTDDRPENNRLIEKGDLVIAVNVAGRFLQPRSDACFCLHNFPDEFHARFPFHRQLRLQVYTRGCLQGTEELAVAVHYRSADRTLYQPWGTDLLPGAFFPPVTQRRLPLVFWIGSIWNNQQNQGNLNEVGLLKQALQSHGLRFLALRNVPAGIAIRLIRMSRIAPAIAGRWQVEQDYLPCRLFKNVSYGHVGLSNVAGFREIFGPELNVPGNSIAECVAHGLALDSADYAELCRAQQARLVPYTYVASLQRIAMAFENP